MIKGKTPIYLFLNWVFSASASAEINHSSLVGLK